MIFRQSKNVKKLMFVLKFRKFDRILNRENNSKGKKFYRNESFRVFLSQIGLLYYQMESHLSKFLPSKIQKIQIELIEIEESLKFAQRGSVSIRQNFCKCLKAFYEIEQFTVRSMDPYLYQLLRKIFDCLSSAFCKAMDMIVNQDPNQPLANRNHMLQSQQCNSSLPSDSRFSTAKPLGGARISISRGLQARIASNPQPLGPITVTLSRLSSTEQDEIECAMNQVRAFLNNYFTKSSSDDNMQNKLSTILSYFNECEKQAVGFLDTKTWEENIELEVGYRDVISQLGDRKGSANDALQKKWRAIVGGLMAIVDKLRNKRKGRWEDGSRDNSISSELSCTQRQLAQTHTSPFHLMHPNGKKWVEQSVQTLEAVELSTLHEFINEKTVLLENQLQQNSSLVDQIYHLKLELEGERHAKSKYMRLVESTSQELGKLKDVYYPLSEEMAQLEKEYNALYDKLSGLWSKDIKECVEEYSKEYTLEMRMSILHVVEAVLTKLGLFNLPLSDEARKKPKFKFRVGMFKAIDNFDMHESFMEEVTTAKVEHDERTKTLRKFKQSIDEQAAELDGSGGGGRSESGTPSRLSLSEREEQQQKLNLQEKEQSISQVPKLRRMISHNRNPSKNSGSFANSTVSQNRQNSYRFTKQTFAKKKGVNRSSEFVQIPGTLSQHAYNNINNAPQKSQKFRQNHSGSMQPIRMRNTQKRRDVNSIVTALPILEQAAGNRGEKKRDEDRFPQDRQAKASDTARDASDRREMLVDVGTITDSYMLGRKAQQMRDCWMQTEPMRGSNDRRRSDNTAVRRGSAAMIQLSNKPLQPFGKEKFNSIRRVLTQQDGNNTTNYPSQSNNNSSSFNPNNRNVSKQQFKSRISTTINASVTNSLVQRLKTEKSQAIAANPSATVYQKKSNDAKPKFNKTASELLRPRASLIEERTKNFRFLKSYQGDEKDSSHGSQMSGVSEEQCGDQDQIKKVEENNKENQQFIKSRELKKYSKEQRSIEKLIEDQAPRIPIEPFSKNSQSYPKVNRITKQSINLLQKIDDITENIKALRKQHKMMDCIKELAESIQALNPIKVQINTRISNQTKEKQGQGKPQTLVEICPLLITKSNMFPMIKHLKNLHAAACKTNSCHHLQRFYDNLKKIASGNLNTNRKVLNLKPLEIRKVEHQPFTCQN